MLSLFFRVPCLTKRKLLVCLLTVVSLLSACHEKKERLFKKLTADETGIQFVNFINDNDSLSILDYLYFYNGGGVAIGDINNDGWDDVYFTANKKEGNKLYLNKGNWKFEDITIKAGVSGKADWHTGVTMADINGDGLLDIYVCAVTGKLNLKGGNQLFINKGDGKFSEKAEQYGLAFNGFSTQAAFFDYDKDGDLDCYLLTHSDHSVDVINDTSIRHKSHPLAGDKFLKNDNDFFKDVSQEAGIMSSALGYGLGIGIGDLNNDGWEDIYIGNDFHENDYCYINQQNGSFSEEGKQMFDHYSRFSMGNDLADYNNDATLDVITVDMLPNDEKTIKTYAGDDPLDIYQYKITANGFQHQLSRNTLHKNNGDGSFSDVALLNGVSATDWSWSPLLADFDMDGIKDLFISNGIVRRPLDLDYVKFISNQQIQATINQTKRFDKKVLEQMPDGKVHNYIYKGTKGQAFIDESESWGFESPTLSNGAAYADLDNDGDLDLITNDINDKAGVYQNNSNKKNYLKIVLKSKDKNRFGIGTKLYAYEKGKVQYLHQSPTRGFQSSVSPVLQFAFESFAPDSLIIIWPDFKKQIVKSVQLNQTITLYHENAKSFSPNKYSLNPLFENRTGDIHSTWSHKENDFFDFNQQYLIPHELSTLGPKLAVADVNNDGLTDFFICGAQDQTGALFIQNKNATFDQVEQKVFEKRKESEGVDAVFADVNGDEYSDLYIVSGGNRFSKGADELADHLYLNDGKGNFTESETLPKIKTNKSCVAAADIDLDGDIDLFIGSRSEAGTYGILPESYILNNDGKGNFKIAHTGIAPGLKNIGMVSDAAFADFNGDNKPELLVVGEWMSPVLFLNTGGKLIQNKSSFDHSQKGWWQSLHITDIDGDGDLDIIAGNYGLNSKLKATTDMPLKMYMMDYDKNGKKEQLLVHAQGKKYYTFLGKDELEKEIPSIRKEFLTYSVFASQDANEIFGAYYDKKHTFTAATLATTIFLNEGNGYFKSNVLPSEAQYAPIFGVATIDIDKDGRLDVFCGGNFYGVLPFEGRYDASIGCILKQGKNSFQNMPSSITGINIKGEVRDIKTITLANHKTACIIARNNDFPLLYVLNYIP